LALSAPLHDSCPSLNNARLRVLVVIPELAYAVSHCQVMQVKHDEQARVPRRQDHGIQNLARAQALHTSHTLSSGQQDVSVHRREDRVKTVLRSGAVRWTPAGCTAALANQ